MKNLFYDEVVYECDLGEMSFAKFLPHWVEEESIFYWSTWKKGLDEGYYLDKRITKNHFIIVQRHGGKFTPNIEAKYSNGILLLKFHPRILHYFTALLPAILIGFAIFNGFPIKVIWIGITTSLYILFWISLSLKSTLKTIKHDLELEFRYQKIKYAVKDGETYYPTS